MVIIRTTPAIALLETTSAIKAQRPTCLLAYHANNHSTNCNIIYPAYYDNYGTPPALLFLACEIVACLATRVHHLWGPTTQLS
jgi:hypothetical protein